MYSCKYIGGCDVKEKFHEGTIYSSKISPNGTYIAYTTSDGNIEIYKISSGKHMLTIPYGFNTIITFYFSLDEKYFIYPKNRYIISIHNILYNQQNSYIKSNNYIDYFNISFNGKYIMATIGTQRIDVYNLLNGDFIKTLYNLSNSPFLSNLFGDRYMVREMGNKTIKLYCLLAEKYMTTIKYTGDHLARLIVFPNEKYVVLYDLDKKIKIHDFQSGRLLRSINIDNHIMNIRITPDNNYIIAKLFGPNQKIAIYKLSNGKKIRTFYGPSDDIFIPPDNKYIMISGNSTRIYECVNKKIIKIIKARIKYREIYKKIIAFYT